MLGYTHEMNSVKMNWISNCYDTHPSHIQEVPPIELLPTYTTRSGAVLLGIKNQQYRQQKAMPGIHIHTSQACQGTHTGRIYVRETCDIGHKLSQGCTYMNQSLQQPSWW